MGIKSIGVLDGKNPGPSDSTQAISVGGICSRGLYGGVHIKNIGVLDGKNRGQSTGDFGLSGHSPLGFFVDCARCTDYRTAL